MCAPFFHFAKEMSYASFVHAIEPRSEGADRGKEGVCTLRGNGPYGDLVRVISLVLGCSDFKHGKSTGKYRLYIW